MGYRLFAREIGLRILTWVISMFTLGTSTPHHLNSESQSESIPSMIAYVNGKGWGETNHSE